MENIILEVKIIINNEELFKVEKTIEVDIWTNKAKQIYLQLQDILNSDEYKAKRNKKYINRITFIKISGYGEYNVKRVFIDFLKYVYSFIELEHVEAHIIDINKTVRTTME